MEVRVTRGPVRNPREGMRYQDFLKQTTSNSLNFHTLKVIPPLLSPHLCLWMDQAHAVLINRNQKHFRVIWLGRLLHLEERGSESGPPVEESQL